MPEPSSPLLVLFDDAPARCGEGQCDCACLESAGAEIAPPPPGPYRFNPPVAQIGLRAGVHALAFADHRMAVANDAALHAARSAPAGETADLLLRAGLIAPLCPPVAPRSRMLTAWLHLTDRCTLGCAYCYRPHRPADMSLDTALASVEATFRSARAGAFAGVKLKFAGGEPLLRLDVLAAAQRRARSLAEAGDLRLEGVVLSNGTRLDRAALRALVELDLRLMLSLDTLDPFADLRVDARGRSHAAQTLTALDRALEAGLRPEVSVTLARPALAGLAETVRGLAARGVAFSLNFYRPPCGTLEGDPLAPSGAELLAALPEAFAAAGPNGNFLRGLLDRVDLGAPHARACAAGESALAFAPDGSAAACQMRLDQALAACGDADPLANVRLGFHPAPRETCVGCDWRAWCAGGCPLVEEGRAAPYCAVYRALMPELVRLEGERLLARAGMANPAR